MRDLILLRLRQRGYTLAIDLTDFRGLFFINQRVTTMGLSNTKCDWCKWMCSNKSMKVSLKER
jgi:hypothetical protein